LIVEGTLPDMSGSEIVRSVRSMATTRRLPVIMIGTSAAEIDRVVAFEVGADDYVTKPFSVRELVLRVRAVLRRRRPAPSSAASALRVGVLEIDATTQRAVVAGEEIDLSGKELRLLLALHRERGRVRTREELIGEVWGSREGVSTRTVDACMKRLRAKLGPASGCIATVRGVGYRLVTAEELERHG
jgi:two-component system phosphate regulon response regulator PhoB